MKAQAIRFSGRLSSIDVILFVFIGVAGVEYMYMASNSTDYPDLEARFLQPKGWQWRECVRDGYALRYGYVKPAGARSLKKVVVALPGLSEFCEKYFELAHDCLAQGYGFVVLDWRGQGRSSRYLDNPHKRHSQGFMADAYDLKSVLDDLPATYANADLYMLAHSMGGNIGLRFLDHYAGVFTAATFLAPLIGLHVFEALPEFLSAPLTHGLQSMMAENYVPMGGDWEPFSRDLQSHIMFSTDIKRAAVHNAWMRHDPALRVGHVTNQWIDDAHRSCLYIQHDLAVSKIDIPCLFFVAGHEKLVDNGEVKLFANRLGQSNVIEFPRARHEIWMESDLMRHNFLLHFYSLIETGAL